jgi:hypothetical protein
MALLDQMYRLDTSQTVAGGLPGCKLGMAGRGVAGFRKVADRRRTLTRVLTQRSSADVADARCVVDYALARRASLTALRLGRVRREDVCDAQTYLRRAARYHGERAGSPCPICADENLLHVTYAYGEYFPSGGNGRARARRELRELAGSLPEFSVFVVEVCLDCGWNHLVTSYVLGTGEIPARRRRAKV